MDFDAQPGFCILGGVVNDAFGDGEDKITLMVLADSGELLILSGYNLARDHHALYLFLTELLENAKHGWGGGVCRGGCGSNGVTGSMIFFTASWGEQTGA